MDIHNEFFIHAVMFMKPDTPLPEEENNQAFEVLVKQAFIDKGCEVFAVGGTRDHIHVLMRMNIDLSLDELMQKVRHKVEWEMNKAQARPRFFMEESYYAFTISGDKLKRERTYVLNQENYHKQKSLEEELIDIREQNGMSLKSDPYGITDVSLN